MSENQVSCILLKFIQWVTLSFIKVLYNNCKSKLHLAAKIQLKPMLRLT